jgi:hypothetical protein
MVSWSQDPQGYIMERSEPIPFSGCWLWTGALDGGGYGIGTKSHDAIRAHRLSFEAFHGPLDGGHVCHTCDVRSCVNPAHLFSGTAQDNMTDKTIKGRQALGDGHGMAKITEAIALAIMKSTGTLRSQAELYGISTTQVSNIRTGKSWKHLHAA